MRYKQDRLCHQWQTSYRYKLYITYLQINFLFGFFVSLFIENRSRKVIELIFWFIWFVYFPFLKSKMKWMKRKTKKNCPLENKKEKQKKKKKGVSTVWPCSCHWGNQMMSGQRHLATSEPMKSPVVEGEWLMLNNSVTKWPPASKATACTITHSSSFFFNH